MNTKEILGDQFETLTQIVKKFLTPTETYLKEVETDPYVAMSAVEAVENCMKTIVGDIKYDLENKNPINLNYLTKLKDNKEKLKELKVKLQSGIDEHVQAVTNLLNEIERL